MSKIARHAFFIVNKGFISVDIARLMLCFDVRDVQLTEVDVLVAR